MKDETSFKLSHVKIQTYVLFIGGQPHYHLGHGNAPNDEDGNKTDDDDEDDDDDDIT